MEEESIMKRNFLKSLGVVALAGMTTFSAHAQDKTITMGTLSWDDLTPITAVTKKVLEDAGYTVKVTNFAEWGIAFAALGKGDVQLLASQINYVSQDHWDKNKSRLEKISPVSHGLYQAFAVPKYVPINTVEELNANADKFGNKLIGIEPGSGLMREAAAAVKAYGLKPKLVEGSTAAMSAAVKSATDRKEWVVATVWEPSEFMKKYDLKFLKDSKAVFAPAQSYYWIANKGFSAKYPQARELVAGIYLPLDDNNDINLAVSQGKKLDEVMKGWFADNADLMKRWSNIKKD
jgi:glycine betaine/proline transport system substrate-binding protein